MLTYALDDDSYLATLEPWQAAEFAAFTDGCRDHLAPWLPWSRTVVDTASARDFLSRFAERQARDDGRIYGIWVKGELVGGTLFRIFDTTAGFCELGVWLSPAAQGRGLVSRAAQAMIDWAVGARGLRRVEWRVFPENTPSIAVAKRLGFTYEGTLRKSFDGHDVEVWALVF